MSCGTGLCSGQSLCRAVPGCVLDSVCVVLYWALFWTEFVSCGTGLCSGQSLSGEALGSFLDTFYFERACSGLNLCREAVDCILDTIPCCARVGCMTLCDTIVDHLIQPCSLMRVTELRITEQANRLEE